MKEPIPKEKASSSETSIFNRELPENNLSKFFNGLFALIEKDSSFFVLIESCVAHLCEHFNFQMGTVYKIKKNVDQETLALTLPDFIYHSIKPNTIKKQKIATDSFNSELAQHILKTRQLHWRHFNFNDHPLSKQVQLESAPNVMAGIYIENRKTQDPIKMDSNDDAVIEFFFQDHQDNFEALAMMECMKMFIKYHMQERHWKQTLQQSYSRLDTILMQLQKTQDQLMQSDKMATIGQLAAGVAHEINNPVGFVHSNINTLSSYVAVIKQVLNLYEELKQNVSTENSEKIQPLIKSIDEIYEKEDILFIMEDTNSLIQDTTKGAQNIKEIVDNLKSFARVNDLEAEEADLNECIESTLKVIHNELKYSVEVVKEFSELPPVMCFAGKLNQVFMNLIVNAKQACKEHGVITIKTAAINNSIVVKISDNGCGIPKENLDRIFEPFFTTKAKGVGTGLGLPISYNIIEQHQGTMDVSSEIGKGTTFTISIPIDCKPTPPPMKLKDETSDG